MSRGGLRWKGPLAVLLGLAVLYLVIGNAALPPVLRSIGRTTGVELTHGMAYTLYPGHVEIRDLRISDGAGGASRLLFERARLRWDTLELAGGSVRAEVGDAILRGPIAGRLLLGEPRFWPASAALRGGTVVGRDLALERPQGGAAGGLVQVEVVIRGGELSTVRGAALDGAVRARGEDASVLLDAAGLEGAARFALSSLEGRPFALAADVTRGPGVLLLDEVRLDTAGIEGRGALHLRGDDREGAFLVRRGRLLTGISIEGERVEIVLDPEEGWLASRLAPPPP